MYYNFNVYINVIYKKSGEKWSGKACPSSGTTSATLAEAVACIDQLWEMVLDGDRVLIEIQTGPKYRIII